MKSGAILPKEVFELKIALIGHVTIYDPKKHLRFFNFQLVSVSSAYSALC